MDNKYHNRNKKLFSILEEFKSNSLDIKATCSQINTLYKSPIIVKCFHDESVSVYGILQNNKPIRFNHKIFKFMADNKDDTLNWLNSWNKYKVTGEEKEGEPISTFSIYSLETNKINSSYLIMKMDISSIKSFETEQSYPFFIRLNLFHTLLKNIEFINTRINNYYKFDKKEEEGGEEEEEGEDVD